MGKLKYTPGPWKYREQPVKSAGYYIETGILKRSNVDEFIGEVGGGLQATNEILSNAKLIANAPLMYEILQELIKDHEAEEKDINKEFDTYWNAKSLINQLENE